MIKIIKWTVIVAVLGLVGYWGYGQVKPKEPEIPMMEEPQVISFPVIEESIVSTVQVKGTSEYGRETNVYAPFEAKVESWNVENGQQIKKGDALLNWSKRPFASASAEGSRAQKRKLEQELKEFTLNQDLDNAPALATEAERLKMLADQENARLSSQLDEVTNDIERQTLADLNDRLKKATYLSPATGLFLFDPTRAAIGDGEPVYRQNRRPGFSSISGICRGKRYIQH